MRLVEKKVLITGGGSGIGRELARRLAARNDVMIAGRDKAKLDRACAETPGIRAVPVDVTSEDSAQQSLDRVAVELGGLDLLVHSAGVMHAAPIAAPDSASAIEEELAVNLGGSIRMTRLALPLLTESPESGIVFISSAVALFPAPGLASYAATKAAVHSFARTLRVELADKRVRVFEVLPPVVDTEMTRGMDVSKIPADAVVDAIVGGVSRDREEIPVERIKALLRLARFAPGVADKVLLRALRAPV
jgi:uncharacterized oxidoreductase